MEIELFFSQIEIDFSKRRSYSFAQVLLPSDLNMSMFREFINDYPQFIELNLRHKNNFMLPLYYTYPGTFSVTFICFP